MSLKLLQIYTHSPSEPSRARGPKRKKPPTVYSDNSLRAVIYSPNSALQNSTTKCGEQQTLQRGKLYKTTNSTKQQTLQSGKLNDKVQQTRGVKSSWREKERETTSGAEGGRGKTVGRSAKVEWRVKSSLSSSIPPPAPTPPAPRVHFTIAGLFETVELEPKILV